MAYLSLYRKYRSQSFEELSGQEHVTRTLQNALRAGRIGHAYLFSGPRGTGKTSTARLLARALNCEHGPGPNPCGECVPCQEIRDGVSPSVVEIDAASSRGIDEVRDLRQRVMTVPSQPGARKVFIVDEVHMLTPEACNALLKTLEEPPAHVLFILATTDAQKLPATILSRCQRFEFRRGSVGLIGERIKYVAESEGYTLEPEAVRLIARASGGSWRDAISLLEQALSFGDITVTAGTVAAILGAVEEEALFALAEGLAEADGRTVYPIIGKLIDDGTEPRQLARDLGEHFRALLMVDAGALPSGVYSVETARHLEEQAARFSTPRLVAALESLAQAEKEMRWSDSGRVVLEVALARLMLPVAAAAGRETAPVSVSSREPVSDRVADGRARAPIAPPVRAAEPAVAPERAGNDREEAAPAVDRAALAAATPDSGNGETAQPNAEEFDPFEQEELPPTVARGRAGIGAAQASIQPTSTPQSSLTEAQTSGPGLSLDQLRARWQVLVEELKRARPATTAALLAEAQPVSCDGQTVVIGFRYSTLRDKWDRGDHKQRLGAALKSVFGQSLPVRSEVLGDRPSGNGGPASEPSPSAAEARPARSPAAKTSARPSSAPEVLEGDPLVHEVLAVFEGQIVEPDPR
jgi:DNA polymerase-3 subunit gamma/tau